MFAKTTKVLVTALLLVGTSLTLVASASAAPAQPGWSQPDESYMKDRHDPTNTNGF
jgi:Spy/CpxP family protein refolding chaperone